MSVPLGSRDLTMLACLSQHALDMLILVVDDGVASLSYCYRLF